MKNLSLPLFVLLFLVFNQSFSQNPTTTNVTATTTTQGVRPDPTAIIQRNGNNFQRIQLQQNQLYQNGNTGRGSGYKQWKRWEWFMQDRLDANGNVFNHAAANKEAYDSYQRAWLNRPEADPSTANWVPIGPTAYTNGPSGYNPGIGRVNVVTVDPNNSSTIYVGTPAGGLWRSTDLGVTWTPLTDNLTRIGISGVVVDPANSNHIYILTGDGDAGDTGSIGVYESTDNGATWSPTGLTYGPSQNIRGYKLRMHPTNNQILFVAARNGIHRTTDGGTTWSQVQSGSFRDLEFKPGDPTTVYATTTNRFYKSTNTGASFTAGYSIPNSPNRAEIGVSPDQPDWVYIVGGSGGALGSGTFSGIFRSTDSGQNFTTQTTTPNMVGSGLNGTGSRDQSWYNLCIAVDPNNANILQIGGVNQWRSTDGGSNWTMIAYWYLPGANSNNLQYTHADNHDLVYYGNVLYLGNDGGVYRSTDNGLTWTNLTFGIQNGQMYRIAGTQADENFLIMGNQDCGSNKWIGPGQTNWTHMYGADGMDCMVDHTSTQNLYFSTQRGGLRKSTNGGNSNSSIKPSGTPDGLWVTPYVMDPNDANTFYGTWGSRVYKNTNGPAATSGNWTSTAVGSGIRYLAIGTNNSQVLYAAANNTIWRSADGGATFTNVTNGALSTGVSGSPNITCIAVNPDDADDVWVTLSAYSSGNKVFESNDGGATWTNHSGTLPNVPVNCIAYEDTDGNPDDALFIGTDIGVYYRDDSQTDWVPYDVGLPNTTVMDLEIHYASRKIRAGTYGRGLWESTLGSTCLVETIPPVITCPADIIVDTDSGVCEAVVNYPAATATDNCPGTITITSTPSSGSTFSVGTASVSCIATDVAGNADTCTFTVTVNDTEAPEVTCPAAIVVGTDSGVCEAVVNYPAVTATDNCPGAVTIVSSPVSGSTFTLGTTSVMAVATDAAGNADTCTFTITVNDSTPPVITCPGDTTVSNDQGVCEAVVNYDMPTATDNCSIDMGITTTFNDNNGFNGNMFDVEASGGDDVTITAFTGHLEDPGSDVVEIWYKVGSYAGFATNQGAWTLLDTFAVTVPNTATPRKVKTELNAPLVIPAGQTYSIFYYTRKFGNVEYTNGSNTYTDPYVKITTGLGRGNGSPGNSFSGSVYNSRTWNGTIDYSIGASINQIVGLASGNAFPVGTTTNTFVATDNAGNADTCSFTVTVNDTEAPTSPNCVSIGAIEVCENDTVRYIMPLFDDNCDGTNIPGTLLLGQASGTVFPLGTTPVEYGYTDSAGNSDTCRFSVFVQERPSAPNTTIARCDGDLVGFDLQAHVDNQGNGVLSSFMWQATAVAGVTGISTTPQSGAMIMDSLVNTTLLTKIVTYTVTPTSNMLSCVGNDFTVRVRLRPSPRIQMSAANICPGNRVNVSSLLNDFSLLAVRAEFYDSDPRMPGATVLGSARISRGVARTSDRVFVNPSTTTTYWVTGFTSFGCTHTIPFDVSVATGCFSTIRSVVMLEGAFNTATTTQRTSLQQQSLLPATEPYTGLGYAFYGGGGETMNIASGVQVGIVDWVVVELRDPADPAFVVYSRAGLLLENGAIVDVDGQSPLALPVLPTSQYYVAIIHRNHLGLMSAQPVTMGGTIDFTDPATATYGTASTRTVKQGKALMYAGDGDGDGQIQNTDNVMQWMPNVGTTGYKGSDYNLDGQVQNTDMIFLWRPNAGRGSSLPD